MPIAGAHAVAGAYLHFTAARDKLPEMLFAGNMTGGAFGARARLCARGRSGGRMIAPRGGAANTLRYSGYVLGLAPLRAYARVARLLPRCGQYAVHLFEPQPFEARGRPPKIALSNPC